MTSLTHSTPDGPFWTPGADAANASQMRALFRYLAAHEPDTPGADAPYAQWHMWSVREPARFWSAVWKTCGIISDHRDGKEPWASVVRRSDRMVPPSEHDGPVWFEGARLNFAENLLRRRDNAPAIISRTEDGRRTEISFAELHDRATSFAAALTDAGIQPGDRVAAYLPNIPEAVIAMLGATLVGAVWSSCSPDFGIQGVLDRFGQIEPRILITTDAYTYAGKRIDLTSRIPEITRSLPTLTHLVVVPAHPQRQKEGNLAPLTTALLPRTNPPHPLGSHPPNPSGSKRRLPFDHPVYVMFSSGTTGLPKCLVHGAGGTLLQHLKEHRFHVDLRPGERIFYFTTCGWMMWNWLVSALASEATIVLYDGAPMPPDNPAALWDLVAEENVNVFGTSAKFLALSEKAGITPRSTHDLSALRSILSTGSPLAPTSFDYVARDVKPGVHVGSISGGTDIISCFALSNPLLPVWRGELQCIGLGMAVDVFDESGTPLRGAPGELVCTKPFPSMPIAFWNDPDNSKYRDAYFSHFPGVWRHGDWAEFTEHDGLVIHGRSDATLNPGGVRIGTAEIYRQVEQIPDVVESVVIGQELTPGDVRIVLFVRLRDGLTLDDDLVTSIRRRIREGASPHHVPRLVLQVSDIPRTISGKITELAVRDAFHGRPVRNTSAMANPAALEEYRRLGAAHLYYES